MVRNQSTMLNEKYPGISNNRKRLLQLLELELQFKEQIYF